MRIGEEDVTTEEEDEVERGGRMDDEDESEDAVEDELDSRSTRSTADSIEC